MKNIKTEIEAVDLDSVESMKESRKIFKDILDDEKDKLV